MTGIAPVLVVTSVEDSVTWYTEILGFEVTFTTDPADGGGRVFYASLWKDDAGLFLGRDVEMEQTAGHGGFDLTTGDFDQIHTRAVEKKVRFYMEPSVNPMGDDVFGIVDPDGNRIVVTRA